jgi:hypothetical protein
MPAAEEVMGDAHAGFACNPHQVGVFNFEQNTYRTPDAAERISLSFQDHQGVLRISLSCFMSFHLIHC